MDAAGEVTDTGPLIDIVEVVDVTTIAQGGADVPEDVAAAGITLAEGAALLLIFIQFVGTLFLIWQIWDSIMNAAATQGYPPLPHDPSPIVPTPKTTANPMNLSSEESERLQHIKQALGDTYFNSKEIVDLMREGYTDEEIIAILKARRYLAKDNNKDDKFTYNDEYLKALAKKGLDATYLQKAVMAGESAGITPNLTKEEIMQKIDDLDSRIDENEKPFNVKEKSAAYYLSSLGFVVISQLESTTGQRKADSKVITPDGEEYELEIKTLSTPNPPATANSVANAIKSATKDGGQSDRILIDGRAKGLTEDQADIAIKKKSRDLERSHVKFVRILGVGFDKTYTIPSK